MDRKLYLSNRNILNGDFCVYCGLNASTADHFPPVSATYRGLILPSCKECNSLAGTLYPFDFLKRAECVKEKIRKRNKSVLETPNWTEDDLAEMGQSLRQRIRSSLRKKSIVQARLDWDALAYLSVIDTENELAQFICEAA